MPVTVVTIPLEDAVLGKYLQCIYIDFAKGIESIVRGLKTSKKWRGKPSNVLGSEAPFVQPSVKVLANFLCLLVT
jgi:hypothetical protein